MGDNNDDDNDIVGERAWMLMVLVEVVEMNNKVSY